MISVYSTRILLNFNHRKACQEYTVIINEASFDPYRWPKSDQAKGLRRPKKKSSSVAMSCRFGRKMMVLPVDIRVICFQEILAENQFINAPCSLQFFKRLAYRQHGNWKYIVWLLDENAWFHCHNSLLPGLSKGVCNACFTYTKRTVYSPLRSLFHLVKLLVFIPQNERVTQDHTTIRYDIS